MFMSPRYSSAAIATPRSFCAFSTTRMTVAGIDVRLVGPKQRNLALARLFRILMVRWAARNEIYYSA